MKLIDDAKKVLLQSWSVRLSVLSALAGALAEFQQQLPALQSFMPAHYFGPLSIACALGATLARVLHQERMEEKHDE
jgi:hypothetical protein